MPEHHPAWKLLITSPACTPTYTVPCSFLVSLVSYTFLANQLYCPYGAGVDEY